MNDIYGTLLVATLIWGSVKVGEAIERHKCSKNIQEHKEGDA